MLPAMKQTEGTDKEHSCWSGAYSECCEVCPLFDKECVGCGHHRMNCIQRTCHKECYDCGGGPRLRYTEANVPTICCKSPYKDLYLAQVRRESFKFKPRPLIELNSRAVVINQGSPGQYRASESPYPENTELVAVNLRHVWSTRGWFSHDMKSYLHVPSDTKLLLLTATHDDVLHRAWNAEVHETDFAKLGFDYWQALEFSQYTEYSKFSNVWEGYRAFRAIEASKAHFSLSHFGLSFTGQPEEYRLYAECAEAIPQLVVNFQLSVTKVEAYFRAIMATLKRYLKFVPAKAVWFIGVVSADIVYNVQKNLPDHLCYFLSVNPWLAAHKGDEFGKLGGLRKSKLPRLELLLRNQRNYANLVNDAVRAAKGSNKRKAKRPDERR